MADTSPTPEMPNPMPRIFAAIRLTRYISVLSILSSLVGALVMFWMGATNTMNAILLVLIGGSLPTLRGLPALNPKPCTLNPSPHWQWWVYSSRPLLVAGAENTVVESSRLEPTELATIELLECLDDFLVGLAFLYFAYGIYSLFIQLGKKNQNAPSWLEINSIGTLKKTLLEVLVVLLAVIFVKGLLERLSSRGWEWTYLVIPLSILAIAASTRLLQFEDKAPKET